MLYPPLEPYDHGLLDVGDGHRLYWETCGSPDGLPVVVLHGGPGSGCTPDSRRYFDPTIYRIVLFDQRNCGRSLPSAADPETDLSTNTTAHLLVDMERLREYLHIDRWLLFGGSWGTTLALAYAEQHPQRVLALMLYGITTTRPSEIDWLYRGVAPLFPEAWARFRAGVPPADRDGDLVAAYYRLLQHADPAVRTQAARDWMDWEAVSISVDPNFRPRPQWFDPTYQMTRSRIVAHYFYHRAWLADGLLLREAYRLVGIPGVMVQGRLDLGAPLVTAWELAQVWTTGELVIVNNAGHSPNDPGMTESLIAAADRFARSFR